MGSSWLRIFWLWAAVYVYNLICTLRNSVSTGNILEDDILCFYVKVLEADWVPWQTLGVQKLNTILYKLSLNISSMWEKYVHVSGCVWYCMGITVNCDGLRTLDEEYQRPQYSVRHIFFYFEEFCTKTVLQLVPNITVTIKTKVRRNWAQAYLNKTAEASAYQFIYLFC